MGVGERSHLVNLARDVLVLGRLLLEFFLNVRVVAPAAALLFRIEKMLLEDIFANLRALRTMIVLHIEDLLKWVRERH